MKNKALFVSAHPDDETLGCGGTILRHKDNGFEIYWLIATRACEKDGFSKQSIEQMQKQVTKVSSSYGFSKTFTLDFPATFLDTIPLNKIVKAAGAVLGEVKPLAVYIPYAGDVHTDHRIVSEALWSAAKTFRAPFVKEVYAYETVSETEFACPSLHNSFIPNTFCDISAYFDGKIQIAELYQSELQQHPFPRSVQNLKALATFRGSVANVNYAEAFMCLKRIV